MSKIQRRDFIKKATATAAASFVLPRISIGKSGGSANSKVNVAMIGAGNQAIQAFYGARGENLVAICDVDSSMMFQHAEAYPEIKKAKQFEDFRVMLDKLGSEIDVVCVNTPDHTHFAATMDTMQRGINVFTQKPLVHNIWECRTLLKAKDKYGVKTNMGNQGHTYDGIRQMKEWYEAGVFGQIKEVHSYTGGPNWSGNYFRKSPLPLSIDKIPDTLNWDLWQGPTGPNSFHNTFHPKTWRGFNRYGNGTMGDWFCHIADAPVWVLDLYEPKSVELIKKAGGNDVFAPDGVIIKYEFENRETKAPCTFYWHNGPAEFMPETPSSWTWGKTQGKGTFYYGEKFDAFTDGRSNNPLITDKEAMREFKTKGYPAEKYTRVKGGNPITELIDHVKGNINECGANFDYSARFTEVLGLGLLAARHGGKIEWDSEKMKVTNRKDLNKFLKEPVRDGWEYGEDLWKKGKKKKRGKKK